MGTGPRNRDAKPFTQDLSNPDASSPWALPASGFEDLASGTRLRASGIHGAGASSSRTRVGASLNLYRGTRLRASWARYPGALHSVCRLIPVGPVTGRYTASVD